MSPPPSYWLTRVLFLRCLAIVYHVAFLVALFQNRQLLGSRGLSPIDLWLDLVKDNAQLHNASPTEKFLQIPTSDVFRRTRFTENSRPT